LSSSRDERGKRGTAGSEPQSGQTGLLCRQQRRVRRKGGTESEVDERIMGIMMMMAKIAK
jgi:hypothetical protein